MIEMVLSRVKIDEKSEGQVIVLKEKSGDRLLPIIIGISEVAAIKRRLSGINPPRPMTHDLLLNTIHHLGARVQKVVIDKIEYNTFYAKVMLKLNRNRNSKTIEVDARPSDSIALALRAEAPIFVREEVLDKLEKFEGQPFF